MYNAAIIAIEDKIIYLEDSDHPNNGLPATYLRGTAANVP